MELSRIGEIPYSIDHGDLRPGNIRVNTDRGQIIYDWAWSNYTHPFFTVIGFFHTIRRNEDFKKEKYKLLDVYFDYWLEYASKDELKDIYLKLEKLTRIYHVVADIYWLQSLIEDYPDNEYNKFSADGLVIDKRQQYFSYVLKKLIT